MPKGLMLDRSPSTVGADLMRLPEAAGGHVSDGPTAAGIKSIAELAAIAGVAVSTVSRSLANKPGVKLETRDRIQQLAKMHGFCINTYAQSLRVGKGGERQAAPTSPLSPSEPQPDPFTLRLLKTIFDQATRNGFDFSSRRVEIGQLGGSAAELAQSEGRIRSSPQGTSVRTPITIQIMLNSTGLADCGVGYCVELTAQKAALTFEQTI